MSQFCKIVLTGQHGCDDAHSGQAGNLVDHLVQLGFHRSEGFLRVL